MAERHDQDIKLEQRFSFEDIRALTPRMRAGRLQELTQILNSYFKRVRTQSDSNIFETSLDKKIILALRDADHDLWSWGFDGETEVWGADYMKRSKNASLKVELRSDWTVCCEWVEAPDLEKK